jgi:hypothetical protein
MAIFEFKNAQELGRVFQDRGVKYLFFGRSGTILLGYSDTTQDVGLYVEKQSANCGKLVGALLELGFRLTEQEQQEVRQGKDFIQLRNGPFDLDLIFAPDGIERFEHAWQRRVETWPTHREYRRHHREQTGGKSPEGQGIAAAAIVVQGVVEEAAAGPGGPAQAWRPPH